LTSAWQHASSGTNSGSNGADRPAVSAGDRYAEQNHDQGD
jgi:hypothetical protein